MKYRSDFVTNSSSSSFIVVFKNKEDMEKQKLKMFTQYPEYVSVVFKDILSEECRKTYTEILKEYKEHLKYSASYTIRYEMPQYWGKPYDWQFTDEFKKIEKEYIEEQIEKFKKEVNHRGIFSLVTYDDHVYSELEHDIMPRMPFVYKVLSNH